MFWRPRAVGRGRWPERWARCRAPSAPGVAGLRKGLAGLADQPRPGPVPKHHAETGRRILAVLERAPPSGRALDGTADCHRTGRRARAAGLALSARPEDRSRRAQIVVREQR